MMDSRSDGLDWRVRLAGPGHRRTDDTPEDAPCRSRAFGETVKTELVPAGSVQIDGSQEVLTLLVARRLPLGTVRGPRDPGSGCSAMLAHAPLCRPNIRGFTRRYFKKPATSTPGIVDGRRVRCGPTGTRSRGATKIGDHRRDFQSCYRHSGDSDHPSL